MDEPERRMKMKAVINNNCKTLREKLYNALTPLFSTNAVWVQNHLANCPRCQKRLANFSRVNLAINLLKSQPQKLDLLKRANEKTLNFLNHKLRYSANAEKLKHAQPEPTFLKRSRKFMQPLANAAACFAILFLIKTGVFTSMQKTQEKGEQALKSYYARNVGQSLTDEIFRA